jgi:hypothetical protein
VLQHVYIGVLQHVYIGVLQHVYIGVLQHVYIGVLQHVFFIYTGEFNSFEGRMATSVGGTQKLPQNFKIIETYWHDHSLESS